MWSNVFLLSRPFLRPGFTTDPLRLFSAVFSCRNSLSRGNWMKGNRNRSNKLIMFALALSTDAGNIPEEMPFAQPAFNRAAERRGDSTWLSDAFSTSALIIPLLGTKSLIKGGEPVMVPSTNFPAAKVMEEGSVCKPIFLGLTDVESKPVFAVEVSGICSASRDMPRWLEGTEWVDLRRYGSQLQINDAGLLTYARGMVEWHVRNRFCSHCGEKMLVKEGGHSLQCSSTSCGCSCYPRLDPAVIMLVTCSDYVLLGRQSRWDPGRYSLLAGFVEIGETFEAAVAREVHEESGVKLSSNSIKYVASQPWPFPSSLMVGFTAKAEQNPTLQHFEPDGVVPVGNESLHVVTEMHSLPKVEADSKELEDARWVHKSFLRAVLQGVPLPFNEVFSIPGKNAIAHSLMQWWISHHRDTEWPGNHLPTVEIDEGVFKYVLIRAYDNFGNQKLVVRGDKKLAYHADIFNRAQDKIKHLKLQGKVLGGGRIEHHLQERTIHVYGFSQAYGQANHSVTVTLLKQWFPLHNVSFSWGGY